MLERRIRIERDESPFNPREEYENVGVIACWHTRYKLGDIQPSEEPGEYLAGLPEDTIVMPLYLIDHSGLSISTRDFGNQRDSGRVGFVYLTPNRRAEYGLSLHTEEQIKDILRGEVQAYDHYLRGNLWAYTVEEADTCCHCGHTEWNVIDGCGGFLGDDLDECGLRDYAAAFIGYEAIKKAWEDRH